MRSSSIIGIMAAFSVFMTSCGGGGGSSSGTAGNGGDVTVLATDAPFNALDSFEITVTSVVLTNTDGTAKVFPPPDAPGLRLRVDLLRLHNVTDFWSRASVPAGSYNGISVAYEKATALANGVTQTVQPESGTIQVDFSLPITVSPGGELELLVDYDLADSITDGGGDTVLFDPVLHLEVDPQSSRQMDEQLGIVVSVDPEAFSLQVDVHAREDEEEGGEQDEDSDDLGSKLGSLCVNAHFDTVLRDSNGNRYDLKENPEAFALLAPEQFVRLDGVVADGCLEADRITIFDPDKEIGLEMFRGVVLDGAPSGEDGYLFHMEVDETRHGDLLEEGMEVSVSTDPATLIFGTDGTPVPPANLVAGTWVDVEADVVTDDPPNLSAREMDVRPGRVEGEVTGVDPDLVTLTVATEGSDGGDGDGEGSGTLTAFVADAELSLDGLVPLEFSDLVAGMDVEMEGAPRSDDPSAFVALSVRVDADNIDGTDPRDVDVDASSFKMLVSGDQVRVDADTVTLLVAVQEGARLILKQDSSDEDGHDEQPTLEELFGFLEQNPDARVEIEGLYRGGTDYLFWATEVEVEAGGKNG